MNETQEQANGHVAYAIDRGVSYSDMAPLSIISMFCQIHALTPEDLDYLRMEAENVKGQMIFSV